MSGDAVVGPVKAPRGPAPGAQRIPTPPTLEEMETRLPRLADDVARAAVDVRVAEKDEETTREAWHASSAKVYDKKEKLEAATKAYQNLRDSIARAREEQQR